MSVRFQWRLVRHHFSACLHIVVYLAVVEPRAVPALRRCHKLDCELPAVLQAACNHSTQDIVRRERASERASAWSTANHDGTGVKRNWAGCRYQECKCPRRSAGSGASEKRFSGQFQGRRPPPASSGRTATLSPRVGASPTRAGGTTPRESRTGCSQPASKNFPTITRTHFHTFIQTHVARQCMHACSWMLGDA